MFESYEKRRSSVPWKPLVGAIAAGIAILWTISRVHDCQRDQESREIEQRFKEASDVRERIALESPRREQLPGFSIEVVGQQVVNTRPYDAGTFSGGTLTFAYGIRWSTRHVPFDEIADRMVDAFKNQRLQLERTATRDVPIGREITLQDKRVDTTVIVTVTECAGRQLLVTSSGEHGNDPREQNDRMVNSFECK